MGHMFALHNAEKATCTSAFLWEEAGEHKILQKSVAEDGEKGLRKSRIWAGR